jgi:hypothetical protein
VAGTIKLNEKPADCAVFVIDVAVIVAEGFTPAAKIGGGVYSALRCWPPENRRVPQFGEQGIPPAVNDQVTPAGSLVVAFMVIAGPAIITL